MKKILYTIAIMILGVTLLSCGNETSESNGLLASGVYYAVDDHTKISVHIVVDDLGEVSSVKFDQPYLNTTKQSMNDDLVLESGHNWVDEVNYLSSYLVVNQGWKDIHFEAINISNMTALNAPDSFIEVNYDLSPSEFEYFTLDVDGFVLAWNKAIKEASDSDALVVSGLPTSEEWYNANKPPYELNDGIYYGKDIYHGYYCRVEIENGYIVDVLFDNITAINSRIVINDNGTPSDPSDDYNEVEIISSTTKQALGDDLLVSSGVAWYIQAELMADAIVSHQGWADSWTFTVSDNHEYLDDGIDSVAGVTIAIEGFRVLFDEAIEQAIEE